MHMQAYEDEVRGKGTGVNRSLHRLFDTLAGRGTTAYSGTYTATIIAVAKVTSYGPIDPQVYYASKV